MMITLVSWFSKRRVKCWEIWCICSWSKWLWWDGFWWITCNESITPLSDLGSPAIIKYMALKLENRDSQYPKDFYKWSGLQTFFVVPDSWVSRAYWSVLDGFSRLPCRLTKQCCSMNIRIGTPRIEPGAAEWEAQTVPLCNATPHDFKD